MKGISLLIITVLLATSCQKKNQKCPSSISGTVIDRVTKQPIVDARVYGQGIGEVSGWGNAEYLPFDTILTDKTGFYEFSTEWNVPNWNVQLWKKGYDFITHSVWETDCLELIENFELEQYATVLVSTVDVAALNYDSIYMWTAPYLGLQYSELGDVGSDEAWLAAGQSTEIYLKSDPEGRIEYRFLNDSEVIWHEIPAAANPGDTIRITIEM